VNPGLDGPEGAIQNLADFRVTEFLFVKQQKRPAIFISNIGQGKLNFFRQVGGRLHVASGIFNPIDQRRRHRPAPLPRQKRPAPVSGNRQQPRRKLPALVPLLEAAHHPYQRLLGHVFRVLPVPDHSETKPEDLAVVTLDQLDDRRLVAVKASRDDLPNRQPVSRFIRS
jgi:hypothetical protein